VTFRSKWMNPDFRPKPKTPSFCRICQRDLKPGQAHRMVLFHENYFEAVHRDDWDRARATDPKGVWNIEPIGADCARKLGLKWSRAPGEIEQGGL
jgi:hypothetical protein